MKEVVLVFLPGLGDDRRSFKDQLTEFPNALAVDWIDPEPDETMEHYAVRYAEMIRRELGPKNAKPIVLCGYSLGGMISPYLARELGAVGCVLICSIRGPEQFPKRFYPDWALTRRFSSFRIARFYVAQLGAGLLLAFPRLLGLFVDPDVVREFYDTPTRRLTGLAQMMLEWAYRKRTPEELRSLRPDIPMLQIHGTRDPLLPIGLTDPDLRLPGGHLLVHTHSVEVNRAIRQFLEKNEFGT